MASPTGTARMPTQGSWRPLVMISVGVGALAIDSEARLEDRRGRLHREADHHRLSGGDAAQNAAGMVGEEARAIIACAHLVGVLFAGELGRAKAGTDLDALHGVDGHHRTREIRIEFCVDRGT
ncbi:hypothetical protein ACVWZ3_001283 [Bradyrhizobium sp. i1.3.6]